MKKIKKGSRNRQVSKGLTFVILIVIGGFIGFFARLFGSGLFTNVSIGTLFLGWLVLVAFSVLGVIVHEFGHLVFGLATGYKFSLFRLASFAWFKEDGKIKFTISKNIAAGQCVLAPPEDFGNFKFILYNLGGVLAQFILCKILLVFIVILPAESSLRTVFLLGIVINVGIILLNLIPIKSLEAPNDGANIVEALKSKDATYALYMMFYIHDQLMNGKTISDFPLSKFELNEDADLGNYLIAYIIILRVSWFMGNGEYEKALAEYLRLDLEKLPNYYRDAVMMDLVYLYTVYVPDHKKARSLYNDKRLKAKWKMKFPHTLRRLAAYHYFVLEEKQLAIKLLESAKAAAAALPNKGNKQLEMMEITKFKNKLNSP